MDVTTRASTAPRRVEYTLALRLDSPLSEEPALWTINGPLELFRSFQHRLLTALERGHVCKAECPWLYMFVASHFPKRVLFGATFSRRADRRGQALLRWLTVLRFFLLDRSNHTCSVVVNGVASELVAFLSAGTDDHPNWLTPKCDIESSLSLPQRSRSRRNEPHQALQCARPKFASAIDGTVRTGVHGKTDDSFDVDSDQPPQTPQTYPAVT